MYETLFVLSIVFATTTYVCGYLSGMHSQTKYLDEMEQVMLNMRKEVDDFLDNVYI